MPSINAKGQYITDHGSVIDYLPSEPSDGHISEIIHPGDLDKPVTETSYIHAVDGLRHEVVDEELVRQHWASLGRLYPAEVPAQALPAVPTPGSPPAAASYFAPQADVSSGPRFPNAPAPAVVVGPVVPGSYVPGPVSSYPSPVAHVVAAPGAPGSYVAPTGPVAVSPGMNVAGVPAVVTGGVPGDLPVSYAAAVPAGVSSGKSFPPLLPVSYGPPDVPAVVASPVVLPEQALPVAVDVNEAPVVAGSYVAPTVERVPVVLPDAAGPVEVYPDPTAD